MPGVEPDEAENYRIISGILASISYSFVLFLYICSMYFLLSTPSVTDTHMRRFLPIFASVVFTISTVSLVLGLLLDFVYPIAFFSSPPNSTKDTLCSPCDCKSLQIAQNFFVILAIWVADGFMIWKCKVLYYGLPYARRMMFLSICWLMVILSFVIGVVYTIPSTRNYITLTFFSCVTLVINVSITTLIVARLIAHRKFVKWLGPGHDSTYIQIIAIFIESAILVVVFNVIFVVFAFLQSSWALIMLPTLVQVYAVNPLIIIFRVAYSRNQRNRMEAFQATVTHMQFVAQKTIPFETTCQYSCSESRKEDNSFRLSSSTDKV